MTDLYVSPNGSDSNNGSEAAPFKTILAASQHAAAGTTIYVEPGTYAGGFITSASGTAAAPITYVSVVPYGAKIVGGGTASDQTGWWNKGDYVTIKGFDIDGSGSQATSWRFGYYGSGSYDTFEGNKVHDILTDPTAFANASASGSGGAAIEMDNYYGGVQGSIIGNTVYNVGPSGQTSSLIQGIYAIESGTVGNNVIYNIDGAGVTTWHGATHINIVNNTIDNARDGGIVVGSGDSGSSATTGDYINVANNIVTNSTWGISETGITGVHNTYTDNVLYNNSAWAVHLQHGLVATGTIVANPNFVNATAHDYHLQAGSPAINAGTSANAPTTDLDGNARPQGGAYDVGAYEVVPSSTPSAGGSSTSGGSSAFYVSPNGSDSNNGSEAAPFKTILAASQHAAAGTTIYVEPGTYAGGFITSASGTAAAPITYVSVVPYGAKIVGGGTASDQTGWWNKGDYVTIKGFDIDGSGSQATSWRFGYYGSGSYDTFEGNKVHDILTDPTAFANASASGSGGAAIEMDNYYGGVQGSIIGNTVYNVGPSGQTSSLIQGIYAIESGTVGNNVIYNIDGAGVTTWHGATHINIVNNTIDNARDGGIVVGSGDSGSSATTGDYINVANNIVTNSTWGISETGITGVHNTYTDNVLYNNSAWAVHLQHGLVATGTIVANPNFVNATAHDYHLQAGSPAINAGTSANAPTTDLDGNARPQGGAYDVGAYEVVPSSTPSAGGSSTSGGSTSGGSAYVGPQPFTLPASAAWTDVIDGGKHAKVVNGTSGNDYLDTLGFAQKIVGGTGDDTIVVYHATDNVVEQAGAGIDTVLSKATSYTLAPNVENATLVGNYAHTLTGNGLDNLIIASSGNDVINAGGGKNVIQAGTGADVLTGGSGEDIFAFHAVGATSTVTNFHAGEDLLDLRPLLAASGYSGTNPIADHTMSLVSNGAGGTTVMVDPTHSGTMHALVTLNSVAPSALHVGADVLWH